LILGIHKILKIMTRQYPNLHGMITLNHRRSSTFNKVKKIKDLHGVVKTIILHHLGAIIIEAKIEIHPGNQMEMVTEEIDLNNQIVLKYVIIVSKKVTELLIVRILRKKENLNPIDLMAASTVDKVVILAKIVPSQENQEKMELEMENALIVGKKDMKVEIAQSQGKKENLDPKQVIGRKDVLTVAKKGI
jgi:hypothetical protein